MTRSSLAIDTTSHDLAVAHARAAMEHRLRHWGRVFGVPPPAEWDEDKSLDGAGGLMEALIRRLRTGTAAIGPEPFGEIVKRDAGGQLVVVGEKRLTAKGKQSEGGGYRWQPDPGAEEVELAALDLYRYSRIRGVVLRVEYCTRGRHREKAVQAGTFLCMHLPLRRYRSELDMGREWIAGRLSPSKVSCAETRRISGKIFAA